MLPVLSSYFSILNLEWYVDIKETSLLHNEVKIKEEIKNVNY